MSVCCREKMRAPANAEAGTIRQTMLAPSARNPTEEPVGKLRLRTAWRSYGSLALSGLTPELSRAAKRRRLGRIVRAQLLDEMNKKRKCYHQNYSVKDHGHDCKGESPVELRVVKVKERRES